VPRNAAVRKRSVREDIELPGSPGCVYPG
jgi:hypothetical protein